MAPLIIAHRGDSAHRPENTLAAFANALTVGADLVELDVQLAKDGQVVVVHDASVDRTTDGSGQVRELTLAELRRLSAGYPERFGDSYRSERIPTLEEVLGLLRERARAMIEIKQESVTDDGDSGIEARTVRTVRHLGMQDEVALISFDRRALLRCRQHGPEIQRGHLFHRADPADVIEGSRQVGGDFAMAEKGMLSEALVARARQAGLRLATWVVDDPEELRALARFDLYGVASNCPGLLLDALWESE